ncbi:hypothetical protein CPB97_009352 [Podila verticillata]|nr:hypothetical protein CPB97_009352 [Podila verticillata]
MVSSAEHEPAQHRSKGIPRRFWVMFLASLGILISYADRSNMAVAIVAIAKEYDYTKQQQGLILSAFFFGYIMTQILGGAMADRYGAKPVLAIGAFTWTLLTFLTPLASQKGYLWMVFIRIGLGLGEGVAFPSAHALIGVWAPPCERSKAVAMLTTFSYLGAVIALPVSSSLVVSSWGWRSIFWLFGSLGLVWSITWHVFGASEPESCRGITEQEVRYIRYQQQLDEQVEGDGNHVLGQVQVFGSAEQDSDSETEDRNPSPELQSMYHALSTERQSDEIRHRVEPIRRLSEEEDTPSNVDHASRWTSFRNRVRSRAATNVGKSPSAPVPWKLLLKRREVWAIILSQFCAAFGFFIMQSWTPTFYLEYFGVDVGKIGYFSVVPSIAQGIVGLSSGFLGDKAVRSWNWTFLSVRRVSQVTGGLGIATALVLAVTVARSAYGAMALITAGMALNGFTMIGASAYQHDICPQYAGFIFSLGNTAGTIPGIVGVMLVGLLVDKNGHTLWGLIWSMVAVFYCIGCTSFVLLSTNKKIHT